MTFKSILFCLSLAASMGQAPVAEAAQLPEPLRTDIATSKNTPSRKVNFDSSWRFFMGDEPKAAGPLFDDSKWRTLTLPHDWSIEHSVDKNAPAGNDGGYYPTGIGWYRKTFTMPAAWKGEKTYLYFEGVYMNSTVYVNGKQVGGHPYGYTSFFCDITDAAVPGKKNVVAVRVDNAQQKNCRWYSGSGIYRHVALVHSNATHIDHWGAAVNTLAIDGDKATVEIATTVKNESAASRSVTLTVATDGKSNTSDIVDIPANSEKTIKQTLVIDRARLWSTDSPNLYKAQLTLKAEGKSIDSFEQTFGIRQIAFSTKGVSLNGKKILINGGCVHHDNGLLGAAAFDRAEVRKVQLMKKAGFNAIRTSHNLPSEAFLDACDSLGMLVIDEAFDGWREAKNSHDYAELFDKWWKADVDGMVLRDRRHPSIMAWSIGNEVIERKKIEIVTTAHRLAAEVHKHDARPVTSALAAWDSDWDIYDPLAAELDITGYNYMIHKAEGDHERVPSRIMWQTESYPRDAFSNWKKVNDLDYVVGDFVWTGIDYLGESGIGRFWYKGEPEGEHYQRPLYPCHAAYCGDIDLTGWRKPISHYRDMLYNGTEKLYMAVKEPDNFYGKISTGLWAVWPTWECWNWKGHDGKNIDVEVYSKYPKVRLYLNDTLVGEKPTGRKEEFKAVFTLPYEEGTLRSEGLSTDGKVMEEKTLSTASAPAALRVTAESSHMLANGQDLCFVQVEVVDKQGRLCPDASLPVKISISGEGTLAAAGSADIKDENPYNSHAFTTWKGRGLVIVRSTHKAGRVTLKLSADSMAPCTTVLRSSAQ